MPTTLPFALEYLLGGIQSFIIMLLLLNVLHINLLGIDINNNEIIQILCLLSFAYPLGYIFENVANKLLPKKDEKHSNNFYNLIKDETAFKIKRAEEFQTSKRMIRITLCNLICAQVLLYTLLATQRIEFSNLFLTVGLFLFIFTSLDYWTFNRITENYRDYLEKIQKRNTRSAN